MVLPAAPSKTNQVVKALETEIRSGRFAPGDKLPSMRVLGERFKVSTMVMHQAAVILEEKGLLTRSSRCGLFITDAPECRRLVIGVVTTILPQFMDHYYEGLFAAISAAGGVAIPVLAGKENDIRNMLAQNPSRVFIDVDSGCCSLPRLKRLLEKVPVTFFNRFEWNEPLPDSGFLLDYTGMTVHALRHLRERGHSRILFLGHLNEPLPFKLRQLREAGRIAGIEFGSPEFQYCGRFDFENNPERIVKIFKKNPPTALFCRSDYLAFEFNPKIEAFYPGCAGMERIGCFNTMWSRIPKHEFSTYDPQWPDVWKQAVAEQRSDVEWFMPKLIERNGKINR